MRRAAFLVVVIGAAVAVAVLVRSRETPRASARREAGAQDATVSGVSGTIAGRYGTVSGTITGRYGTIRMVHVTAEAGDRLLAETWTDTDGRYSLDLPPQVPFVLKALPIPQTYLVPEERSLALRPGERQEIRFDLKTFPVTKGVLAGATSPKGISLTAVREGREGSGTEARLDGREFEFWGLEPGAPYALHAWGTDLELERMVSFRGGETGIVAPLRRVLRVGVEVCEIGTGKDIPAFTVRVVNPKGETFATLEGTDGSLRWSAPHPDPTEPDGAPWTTVVSANGYFEQRGALWFGFVYLQRVRAPNVTLLLSDADGAPFAGDLTARGSPRMGYGDVDARAAKVEPGRYTAVLPPGRWWIRLEPGVGYEPKSCDVTVPEGDGAVACSTTLARRR